MAATAAVLLRGLAVVAALGELVPGALMGYWPPPDPTAAPAYWANRTQRLAGLVALWLLFAYNAASRGNPVGTAAALAMIVGFVLRERRHPSAPGVYVVALLALAASSGRSAVPFAVLAIAGGALIGRARAAERSSVCADVPGRLIFSVGVIGLAVAVTTDFVPR